MHPQRKCLHEEAIAGSSILPQINITLALSILQNQIMVMSALFWRADFVKAVNNYEISNVTFINYVNMCCI